MDWARARRREARGIHGRFLSAGTVQAAGAQTFLAVGHARGGRLSQLGQHRESHGHVGSIFRQKKRKGILFLEHAL